METSSAFTFFVVEAVMSKKLLVVACITSVLFPDTTVQRGSGAACRPVTQVFVKWHPMSKSELFFLFCLLALLFLFKTSSANIGTTLNAALFLLFQLMESPVFLSVHNALLSRSLCCASMGKYTISSYEDGFSPPLLVCIMQMTSLPTASHQGSFTLIISCNCVFFVIKRKV